MPFMLKKIVTPLVLASFLMVAFFGFASMSRDSSGNMQGDCPFSATGVTLCPQDAVGAVMHHLLAYQSYLSVPMSFGMAALIIALYMIGIALVLFVHSSLRIPTAPLRVWYESPPGASYNRKRMRWLSLFENSPASL